MARFMTIANTAVISDIQGVVIDSAKEMTAFQAQFFLRNRAVFCRKMQPSF